MPWGIFLQIDWCHYCRDWLSESVMHSVTLIPLSVLYCHLANVQASFIFRRLSVNEFRNRHWQWPQQSYHSPLGSHLKHILSLVGWKISSDVSIKTSIKFKSLSEMQKDRRTSEILWAQSRIFAALHSKADVRAAISERRCRETSLMRIDLPDEK